MDDRTDINNYRPISLVAYLYNLFNKVLENKISSTLNKHLPQARFHYDHLKCIN